MGGPAHSRAMRIDLTAHIPNTVNHSQVKLGIAIQVRGMLGVKDTSMGHTQGLTTVPTSRGTRDRRTTHTHLTTTPTSSGTGGRRTTHRGSVVSGVWGGGEWVLPKAR
jgi:hypothetical protein